MYAGILKKKILRFIIVRRFKSDLIKSLNLNVRGSPHFLLNTFSNKLIKCDIRANICYSAPKSVE
jgi:hypothetical protein